jgi:hypothetical protein
MYELLQNIGFKFNKRGKKEQLYQGKKRYCVVASQISSMLDGTVRRVKPSVI